MVANLPTVQVPGYAEAVRREQYLRTTAFLGGNEVVCGVEVHPLSLRSVIRLETAKNGFVVPCVFDSDAEAVAHALQVIWFCRPGFDERFGVGSAFRMMASGIRMTGFIRRMLWAYRKDRVQIAREVKQWVHDAFMDAPKCGTRSAVPPPSYAAYPAYLIDALYASGVSMDPDAVLDMPLKRLWQHWRVAVKRANPNYGLTNPSDEIFVSAIAKK